LIIKNLGSGVKREKDRSLKIAAVGKDGKQGKEVKKWGRKRGWVEKGESHLH